MTKGVRSDRYSSTSSAFHDGTAGESGLNENWSGDYENSTNIVSAVNTSDISPVTDSPIDRGGGGCGLGSRKRQD